MEDRIITSAIETPGEKTNSSWKNYCPANKS
jgi:hypothetical protein